MLLLAKIIFDDLFTRLITYFLHVKQLYFSIRELAFPLQWSNEQIRSATLFIPPSVTIRPLISRHSFVLAVTSIKHAYMLT